MNKTMDCCNNYAITLKLVFNASKSISYSSNGTQLNDFILGSSIIPKSKGFVYLGLPIGNDRYVEEFFSEKFKKKTEKSTYSSRALGLKPNALTPETISFIYKQYCQSIFKFGSENLFISKPLLGLLNVRQNIHYIN